MAGNARAEAAAQRHGLGQLLARHGSWPMINILVTPIIAAVTGVLGFGAGIVAYQIIGGALTVLLAGWGLLSWLNRAFLVFEHGLVITGLLGRVARVVSWSEVVRVDGVRVDIVGSIRTVERRDFVVHTTGRPIPFNDFLVKGGADLAMEIAARVQAARGG